MLPNLSGTLRLRVATYNVHGCVGMDGRRSEERIADVIASLNVDIIGLQELDLNRRRSAGMDQAGMIAERLGWQQFFHPAMRSAEEEYGDAIISKYPMNLRQGAVLPSTAPFFCRETRGALWVDIATPIGLLHIINTHFGLGRDERLVQANLLMGQSWIGRVPVGEALVVMGDFNSPPGSRPHRVISRTLRDARTFMTPQPALRGFPTRFPLLAVDHIFVNSLLAVDAVKVCDDRLAKIASDHFPVVAEVGRSDVRNLLRPKGTL